MNAMEILSRVDKVRRSGNGWVARCPAHDDRIESLAIAVQAEKILLHCHAGCTIEKIVAAVGLKISDLFTEGKSGLRIAATYDYLDERGDLLFQVVRLVPKSFKQRRPDGRGRWIWNLKGVPSVLYCLPELLRTKYVLIPEGEKDVETARSMGFAATCNPGGAGKWRDEYSEQLRGKRVMVIADADEPGRKHAQQVAASLAGKVETLKVLELPGAKDLTEWVERGGTREQLLEILRLDGESAQPAAILDAVQGYVRRYMFLSDSQLVITALWVAHTHAFKAAEATPYLQINSAEKDCGKTRLLEVLELLVAEPWFTGRVTAAVLYRKIDGEQPTLLLDESDAAFNGQKEYAEALRGMLNTGYRRGGKASCCVGQGANISARDFSTFCPKAIAGIGRLPDTVASRSISIQLKRARKGEIASRFRARDARAEAEQLRNSLDEWCASVLDQLRDARPALPEKLTDRQQDVAEPLLAIADLAGGQWPGLARHALMELCTHAQLADDSTGALLLTDIYAVFQERETDRLSSEDLVSALARLETSPWAEWSKGKPITAVQLARQLKRYEIAPVTLRIGDRTPRGYRREDFQDAWDRYMPRAGPQGATPQQCSNDVAPSDFSRGNTERDVAARNSCKPSEMNEVATVAPQGSFFEGEL